MEGSLVEIFVSQCPLRRRILSKEVEIVIKVSNFSSFTKRVRSCCRIMF